MNDLIRLSKCSLSSSEEEAVLSVLRNGYLGMGKIVQDFELLLGDYLSNRVVCVSSGTAALHLALDAIGVTSGDEVIVPTLTYLASFQAIKATGATPIPCDIDPSDLNISIADLKNRITKYTKCIMPVYYSGDSTKAEAVLNVAAEHNIRVVADAAHAFGSHSESNRLIGSFGDVTCFSFDGIKNITCGEGGCIVTSDSNLIDRVSNTRLLGVMKDSENRYVYQRSWHYEVKYQGWRYHMSDIMAAIGIEQLKRFPYLSIRRQSLATYYTKSLACVPFLTLVYSDYSKTIPHIFPVLIDSSVDRDMLRTYLLNNCVQTGIHYFPNHLLEYFKNPCTSYRLPNSEAIYPRLLSLPLHPDLTESQIDYITGLLVSYPIV
jgi:dTDP-4-amino-4,6-dideoxygalactose transaminase